jgi:hypothetical protein
MGTVPGTISRRNENQAMGPRPNQDSRKYGASPGVPSLMLFLTRIHPSVRAPNDVKGGSLGKRDPVQLFRLRRRPPACHRRGRSPSIINLATAPMVRRWDAAGGPEGR